MSTRATENGHGNGNASDNGNANGNGKAVNRIAGNGAAEANGTTDRGAVTVGTLIAEAQSLRDSLQAAYQRSQRLVRAFKRHRRQSQLVASTLASLRQLQEIDA